MDTNRIHEDKDQLLDKIDAYLNFHNVYCTENDKSLWDNRKETIESTVEIWKYFLSEEKILRLLEIVSEKDDEGKTDVDKALLNHIQKINKMAIHTKKYKDILIYQSMKCLALAGLFADSDSDIKRYMAKSMSLKALLD